MCPSQLHVGTVDLKDRQSVRKKLEPSAAYFVAYMSPHAAAAALRKFGILNIHARGASVLSTTNLPFEQDY